MSHRSPFHRRLVLALACGLGFACDPLPDRAAPPAAPAGSPTAPPPPAPAKEITPASAIHASAAPAVPERSTPTVPAPAPGAKTADERNTIDVFRAAAPATVFVTQSQVIRDRWSMRTAEVPAGAGTGFIWDADGHIVTNCHVALPNCQLIRGRRPPKLEVTLFDQKTYPAKLLGFDPAKDVAVLQIDPGDAKLVPLARPPKGHQLEVGQKTVAIGNPFGLDHTLTTGVVSALGREVKGVGGLTIRDMIQTDAAINPGNSGGPLLDSSGRLIGMNTMIFSSSGSSAGIGFAVPVETIERLVPQLIRSGRAERVGIGVGILSDADKRRLFGNLAGVVVSEVPPGSAAARSGMRSPTETNHGLSIDVIIGIDGKPIANYDDLYAAFEGRSAGDVATVEVRRLPENRVASLKIELRQLQ